MQQLAMTYDHLIHVDEEHRELQIFRVSSSGVKTLYTSLSLGSGQDQEAVRQLAAILGENLLLDSPVARKLLEL
jgi:hypothetical protein